jgi:ferredoxin
VSSTAQLASFAEVVVKVTVNFDLCASTGACAQVAPEVFVVRNDGYLHILQEQPSPELYDVVQEAADLCPTGAITLED